MNQNLLAQAEELIRKREQKKRWYLLTAGFACMVALCVYAALILPAITMEKEPVCGVAEHTHTESCYETAAAGFSCSLESLEIHTHSEACYDEAGELVCGYADDLIHIHNEYCYDEAGGLVCPLPEVKEHTHSAECFEEKTILACEAEETEDHTHGDDCYQTETVPVCGMEEIVLHTHSEECYDESGALSCGLLERKEHVHTEACMLPGETKLICGLEEHTHDDSCYAANTVLNAEETNSLLSMYPSSKYSRDDILNDWRSGGKSLKSRLSGHTGSGTTIGGIQLAYKNVPTEYNFAMGGDMSGKTLQKTSGAVNGAPYVNGAKGYINYAGKDIPAGRLEDQGLNETWFYDLEAPSTSSNIWCLYPSVGTYYDIETGKSYEVDVKLTLESWGRNTKEYTTNHNSTLFGFRKNQIGVACLGMDYFTIRYDFYKSGTSTKISVKGNTTFTDIDYAQGILIEDNTCDAILVNAEGQYAIADTVYGSTVGGKVYIYDDYTGTSNGNGHVYNPNGSNDGYSKSAAYTELFSGNSLKRTYTFVRKNGELARGMIENEMDPVVLKDEALIIRKKVTGTTSADKFPFTVEITDASGKPVTGKFGDVRVTNGKGSIDIGKDSFITIEDLKVGYTVIVTEDDNPNYDPDFDADAGSVSGRSYTYKATGKGGTILVEVDNKIIDTGEKYDKITIEKYVKGATSSIPSYFNFQVQIQDASGNPVTGTFGDVTVYNGSGNLQISKDKEKEILNLPYGYKVTVTEESSNAYKTEIAASGGKVSNGVYTYTATGKGASVRVMVTNTMIDTGGGDDQITIEKNVIGTPSSGQTSFPFVVWIEDENGRAASGTFGNIKLEAGGTAKFYLTANGTTTISGLPKGYTVRIMEIPGDYTSKIECNGGTITDDGFYVYRATGTGANVKVTVTNTMKDTGEKYDQITIKKTVTGETSLSPASFKFSVRIQDENDNNVTGTFGGVSVSGGWGEFYLSKGEQITISDLPFGYKVTVMEETNDDVYKTEITANPNVGTAAGNTYIYDATGTGANVEVNVNNEILPVDCELIIRKQVNGFVVADREFVFDITIRDENNKPVPAGEYGDLIVGENGTGQLKLRKGEEKTISSLKPDYEVTITEQQDGSFTTTVSGHETNTLNKIISVPSSTVTFINTMKATEFPLSIYKTDGTDPLQGARFSLYPAYVYPNGDWIRDTSSDIRPQAQTTDEEGKAVFKIPAQPGHYLLYEEEAPPGYVKPSKPWRLTVTEDGQVTLTDSENKPVERLENSSISYHIINEKGYVLPETGGIGTTVYTLGGLLLCAAGITLGYIKYRRRRREGDTP